MSELQMIATINVPFRRPNRDQGFRTGLVPRGTRVPANHPAVQQDPKHFRPATAQDLGVHVGWLQKEDV